MTAVKVVALDREEWLFPLTIHMTSADDQQILSGTCDENGKIHGHDADEPVNPNAKFPITVSITDQNGRTLLLEISEKYLTAN
jgi:hypothetical protein